MVSKLIISKTFEDIISKCKPNPYVLHRKDKMFLESFNRKDYVEDKQHSSSEPILDQARLEEHERKQNDYQQETVKLNGNEVEEVLEYTNINYEFINSELVTNEEFRRLVNEGGGLNELATSARIIKRAINKSNGLLEATVMYHSSHWDENMKEGDVGVFDAFRSLSYQKNESEEFASYDDVHKVLKVYVPKDYKGLVVNKENELSYHDEHEYLIGNGARYYVLSTNNNEIEIVLLPPLR